MQRTRPPFRADHVGSLLRPAALKDARAQARARRDRCRGARPQIEDQRDRDADRQTGGDRAEIDHRRRVPPRLVADRFPAGARRHRDLSRRPQDPVQGRRRSRSNGSRASRRSSGASPAIRRSRTGNSSRTTPGRPRRSRSPPRPRCISARAAPPCRRRSIPTWRTSTATSARSTPRWCAASPTPAAAISSSTRSTSPICAIHRCAST